MKKILLRVFYITATILWMGLIFYLSHQTGTSSSGLSNKIAKAFMNIFIPNHENLEIEERQRITEIVRYVVRKMAHFSEFGILAGFSFLAVNSFITKKSLVFIISGGFSILYAITDEFHQSFIGGRSPQIKDVFIDSLGVVTMLLLIACIINVCNVVKKRKKYD